MMKSAITVYQRLYEQETTVKFHHKAQHQEVLSEKCQQNSLDLSYFSSPHACNLDVLTICCYFTFMTPCTAQLQASSKLYTRYLWSLAEGSMDTGLQLYLVTIGTGVCSNYNIIPLDERVTISRLSIYPG